MAQVSAKAHRLAGNSPPDDVVEPDERATAYKEDVGGVDLQELLLRMLAAPFGRHTRRGALDYREQRLLHAFARDIARNRGIVSLARNFVDLVDINDAALATLDVVVGIL